MTVGGMVTSVEGGMLATVRGVFLVSEDGEW